MKSARTCGAAASTCRVAPATGRRRRGSAIAGAISVDAELRRRARPEEAREADRRRGPLRRARRSQRSSPTPEAATRGNGARRSRPRRRSSTRPSRRRSRRSRMKRASSTAGCRRGRRRGARRAERALGAAHPQRQRRIHASPGTIFAGRVDPSSTSDVNDTSTEPIFNGTFAAQPLPTARDRGRLRERAWRRSRRETRATRGDSCRPITRT